MLYGIISGICFIQAFITKNEIARAIWTVAAGLFSIGAVLAIKL